MLPTEVLQNVLLLQTRRELDKLCYVSSGFADIILSAQFATLSPLRIAHTLQLNSLQEVIIIVAKEKDGKGVIRFPLSDHTACWTRLSFFEEIKLTSRVPALLQWICANQTVLHGELLTVPTPLADDLALFNVHSFQHVHFDHAGQGGWRSQDGARQRIPMQCALLRDCENLSIIYGWVEAMRGIVFEIHDIVQWLHRPTAAAKDYCLRLDLKQIDGNVVRLVEMLEEHARTADVPVSYIFTVNSLGPAMVDRMRHIRSRRFNPTTVEYFDFKCVNDVLTVSRRTLY